MRQTSTNTTQPQVSQQSISWSAVTSPAHATSAPAENSKKIPSYLPFPTARKMLSGSEGWCPTQKVIQLTRALDLYWRERAEMGVEIMQALVAVLMVPLMLLNVFGGIGSGIWLAILGEWWAIGYGFVALFSPLILGLAMMPGIIFAGPAVFLAEKGKAVLAFPFLLLGQLYVYAIVAAWCLFAFYVFMARANHETFWPLLIWSYGVALGPWAYMSRTEQETGNTHSSLPTFIAQVAYLVMAAVLIFGRPTLIDLVTVFCGVMLVGVLIQTGIAVAMLREERRLGMP